MSLEDGAKLIDRIIGVVRGDFPPDQNAPAEWIMHYIWEWMRSIDKPLAHEIEEPAFEFWRSQVAEERLKPKTLKSYLKYREKDIASGYSLSSRFLLSQSHLQLNIPPSPTLFPTLVVLYPHSSFICSPRRRR
jgi:hypothetical protein